MERQYALVNGTSIVVENGIPVISGFMSDVPEGYSAKHPASCRWLPVENRDSQPYKQGRTFRGTPTYEVAADVVWRVFPIHNVRRVPT